MARINPHNHPVVDHSFEKGVNDSVHPEKATDLTGHYFDGRNTRVASINGETTAISRIDGEEVYITLSELTGDDWVCLWLGVVRKRIVGIWASGTGLYPSAVSVDNEITLQSTNFPLNYSSVLQVHSDESCGEGEIFVTDNSSPPFTLSVEDMLINKASGSLKYFDDFVFSNYTINFPAPADHPVFVKMVNVGAGNGRPVGKYVYFIRYVDSDGNVSNVSYPTPEIPVLRRFISVDDEAAPHNQYFPGVKNYGADSDGSFSTAYAPMIRFRITNVSGFSEIQIIRADFNTGAGIGYNPVKAIVKTIPIAPDEISVYEYIDSLSNEDENIVINLDDISGVALEIERAKSIRYFDRRLELGNLEYKSLDEGGISFIQQSGQNYIFPVSKDIGTIGHADPVKEAYMKSFMHDEKYSIGVLGIPSNLQKTFVVPVRDNVLVPTKRTQVTGDSETWSDGCVEAATTGGVVAKTFDSFDFQDPKAPNIPNPGFNIKDGDIYPYRELRPKSVDDLQQDYGAIKMKSVYLDDNLSTSISYAPYGFNPNYHTTGMALAGLDSYPSWLQAFSIVRRPRAGRVVCQGLVTYALEETGNNALDSCEKKLDEVFFFSQDLESGYVPASVLSQLENAQSGDFKMRMLSPVGFFTEVFNAHEHGAGGKNDSHIDMVSYARVYRDRLLNGMNIEAPGNNYPGIPKTGVPHIVEGYTSFGNWRNDTSNPYYPSSSNGDKLWTIESVTKEVLEEGIIRWKIKFTENIYLATNMGKSFEDDYRSHEPWYVANIIIEGAENGDESIKNYYPTEHYQKIKSIVGRSNGSTSQAFQIVDERWEDFHSETSGPHDATKRIFVDNGDGVLRRYVNTNNLTVAEEALVDADVAVGGGTSFDGVPVWGKYNSSKTEIRIGVGAGASNAPLGALLYVVYDNRFPCLFYGDTTIDNSLGVMIHQKKSSAQSWDADNDFRLNCAWPYFGWDKADGYKYIRRTDGTGVGSQFEPDSPPHEYAMSRVRQLVLSYICNSFTRTCFAHEPHYPLVNYVQRPNRYIESETPSEQGIFSEYESDYPDEKVRWRYGGFRLTQVPVNFDYSQQNKTPAIFSRPAVGFIENNVFCSRVAWSLKRPINVSFYPGLRTFPINQVYDLDDRRGGVSFLFDSISNGVRNLFAFCEDDVALLVTANTQINSLDGKQLSIIGNQGDTSFIQKDIFLGLQGMPGISWQSASEDENGVFFLNKDSAWYFEGGTIKDIGRPFYRKTIWNKFIDNLINEDRINFVSVFDTKFREYWLGINIGRFLDVQLIKEDPKAGNAKILLFNDIRNGKNCFDIDNGGSYGDLGITNLPSPFYGEVCLCNTGDGYINVYEYVGTTRGRQIGVLAPNSCQLLTYLNMQWTLVKVAQTVCECELATERNMINFGVQIDNWQGSLDYRFDKFASKDSVTYGARDKRIYKLHSGNIINGSNIVFAPRVRVSPESGYAKEFVRIRASLIERPSAIRIYNDDWSAITGTIPSTSLRNYFSGFEQYVPRRSDTGNRNQGKFLNVEIFDNSGVANALRSISVQFKMIN